MKFAGCLAAILLTATTVAEERRLTTDGRLKSSPIFVDRTGTELIYVVQERPTQLRLMRLRLDDLSTVPLDAAQTKSELDPAVSLDGKRFAFIQNRANLSLALVIRDLLAEKTSEVPPAGGFAGPRSPTFSADGDRVIYSFADGERQSLYSVNLEGQDRKLLIDSPGINIWPDCSPDGRRIAWSSSRDQDYEIYSAAIDGSDIRRLTTSPKQDLRPRYSPDSSQLAFMSNRDGNYEIYVMRPDGTDVRRMTDNPESDDYPAWHPDGRQFAIVSERDGRHDLYLIPAR